MSVEKEMKNGKTGGRRFDNRATVRDRIFAFAREKYGTEPEYLWRRWPDYAVLRHSDSRKWYAILMRVNTASLDLTSSGGDCPADLEGRAEVLNIRIADPVQHAVLSRQRGFCPAYHMNKKGWISALPEMLPFEEVRSLIDQSFQDTDTAHPARADREPLDWLIPANVRYCDPHHFFDDTDTVEWTQSSNVLPGDTVYIYAGVPIGAILYRCEAVETDLPAKGNLKRNFHSGRQMVLRLEYRYDETIFTREVLREQYGIVSVRGPRHVPHSLACALSRRKNSGKK